MIIYADQIILGLACVLIVSFYFIFIILKINKELSISQKSYFNKIKSLESELLEQIQTSQGKVMTYIYQVLSENKNANNLTPPIVFANEGKIEKRKGYVYDPSKDNDFIMSGKRVEIFD